MFSRILSPRSGVAFWAATIALAVVLAGCANPLRSMLAMADEDKADAEKAGTDVWEETAKTMQSIMQDLDKMVGAWEKGEPTDADAIAGRVSAELEKSVDITTIQVADHAGRMFNIIDAPDAARKVYSALEQNAAKTSDTQIADAAKEIARSGLARLNLIGSQPSIEGILVDGEKFDWSKYKGKVVLIDFWATWCGPCLRELPNVKHAYEQYHDKGFDVVGISLDDDKDALNTFLESEKLPWATIYDADAGNGGFDKTLAKQFGVDGIPATYLVDREGKIVSISARGPALQKQLEKMLGAP